MKTKLTTEQSNHLVELGIPKEWASLILPTNSYEVDGIIAVTTGEPIFNLYDLLAIIPSSIFCRSEFSTRQFDRYMVTKELGQGKAEYVLYYACKEVTLTLNPIIYEDELVVGLYKLLVWVLENHPKSIVRKI